MRQHTVCFRPRFNEGQFRGWDFYYLVPGGRLLYGTLPRKG